MRLSRVLPVVAGLLGSTVLFYGLREAGLSLRSALIVNALVAAAPTIVSLLRGRRPQGLAVLFTVLLVGGAAVALLPGDGRFLLAKESLLTGVTGVWFLVSTRRARPLAYQFSRPLVEGRLSWPDHWEELWRTSGSWRRMWRWSSVMWGIGTLVDAALRVVMAYTLRPDLVPALSLALFLATTVVLNVITTIYYVRCGAFWRFGQNESSPLVGAVPADGRDSVGSDLTRGGNTDGDTGDQRGETVP
jgi:hypothetical protein